MKKKKKRSIGRIFCLLLALACFGGGIYFLFFYNAAAYKRQKTEQEMGDRYIEFLLEQEALQEGNAGGGEASAKDPLHKNSGSADSETDFSDDNYYERNGVTFTPEYAKGEILCVLEYPAVKIRRGVYTGTWDDIYYDLDIWMVTAASPEMKVGETHMAIYGHNHTSQDLSFNNLASAAVGDEFTLYADSGIYHYEVTRVFAESREAATAKYVDDMSLDKDLCYIITCGRNENRYLDLIVEGKVKSVQTLADYRKSRK